MIWMVMVVIAAVIGIIVLISMLYDSKRFVTVCYKVPCRELKREFKFVMLSDLHNKQFDEQNRKLMTAIRGIGPEAILIAGDMLTSEPVPRRMKKGKTIDTERSVRPAMEFVGALASEYPVYYGNGNHEYRLKTEPEDYLGDFAGYQSALKRKGVVFLENAFVDLPDAGLRIYGLDMEREYYRKLKNKPLEERYLESRIGIPGENVCNLLLAHNPDYFPEYAKWGADVILSGHVHGGIMKLPMIGGVIAPSYRLFPKYDGGLFVLGRSRMILGRGLGSHTIPIRIFNPGELIVVTLVPEK